MHITLYICIPHYCTCQISSTRVILDVWLRDQHRFRLLLHWEIKPNSRSPWPLVIIDSEFTLYHRRPTSIGRQLGAPPRHLFSKPKQKNEATERDDNSNSFYIHTMQTAFTTPFTVRPSTASTLIRPAAACSLRTTTFVGGARTKQAIIHHPETLNKNETTTMKIFDWKKRDDPNFAVLPTEDEGIFKVNNLRPAPGSRHRKKRKGRGMAAGGSRCGFGMRGQKSRSGRSVRPGFEGGQTPLYRRLPKFVGRPMGPGHKRTEYALIKPAFLNECAQGQIVTFQSLKDMGVMTKQKKRIYKVTGGADVTVQGLIVKAHAFTSSAVEAIEKANGKCVLVSPTTGKDLVFEDEEVVDSSDTESESGSDDEDESSDSE